MTTPSIGSIPVVAQSIMKPDRARWCEDSELRVPESIDGPRLKSIMPQALCHGCQRARFVRRCVLGECCACSRCIETTSNIETEFIA